MKQVKQSVWRESCARRARREGWCIQRRSDMVGIKSDKLRERRPSKPRFETHDAARLFVETKAAAGSPFHRMALDYVAQRTIREAAE